MGREGRRGCRSVAKPWRAGPRAWVRPLVLSKKRLTYKEWTLHHKDGPEQGAGSGLKGNCRLPASRPGSHKDGYFSSWCVSGWGGVWVSQGWVVVAGGLDGLWTLFPLLWAASFPWVQEAEWKLPVGFKATKWQKQEGSRRLSEAGQPSCLPCGNKLHISIRTCLWPAL